MGVHEKPPAAEISSRELRVRALLLSDRLNIDRRPRERMVSSMPFCFREGDGYVVEFRYGAVVFIGLPRESEDRILAELGGTPDAEEESLVLRLAPGQEEMPAGSGLVQLKALSDAHVLILADILGKSVALAHYEKSIATVFDTIEPVASRLQASGRIPRGRKKILKLVGSALLAQHRVSGRIAFAEKPDILWEHPELERFYARLEDEYEIIERGTLLGGKMEVIATAAQSLSDMMDAARSARLELLIVLLIVAELVIAAATTGFAH